MTQQEKWESCKGLLQKYDVPYEEPACIVTGLAGGMEKPLRLAGRLLNIAPLAGVRTEMPYRVRFVYSEEAEPRFFRVEDGAQREMPAGEWLEAIGEIEGLDGAENFEGAVSLCAPELKEGRRELWAMSLEFRAGQADALQEKEAARARLLQADEACLILSASKLLSMAEKDVLKTVYGWFGLEDQMVIYLQDMDKLQTDEDREQVTGYLEKFLKGQEQPERPVPHYEEEDPIRQWVSRGGEEDRLMEQRGGRMAAWYAGKLAGRIEEERETVAAARERIQAARGGIARLEGQMEDFSESVSRHIRMYHLREFEASLQNQLDQFDSELSRQLIEGIDEEEDLERLEESLPGFLMASWEEYLSGPATRWMEEEASQLNYTADTYIRQQMNELLQNCLTREETERIFADMHASGAGQPDALLTVFGFTSSQGQNVAAGMDARKMMLPTCFLAAGAVIGLTMSLVPGLALAALAYKVRKENDAKLESAVQALKKKAELMEKEMLKYLKEQIGGQFEELNNTAAANVEDWVAAAGAFLQEKQREYIRQYEAEGEKLSGLEQDLNRLEGYKR